MAEQKADKAIRRMEKEQRKLGKIMGLPAINTQRAQEGGWR